MSTLGLVIFNENTTDFPSCVKRALLLLLRPCLGFLLHNLLFCCIKKPASLTEGYETFTYGFSSAWQERDAGKRINVSQTKGLSLPGQGATQVRDPGDKIQTLKIQREITNKMTIEVYYFQGWGPGTSMIHYD